VVDAEGGDVADHDPADGDAVDFDAFDSGPRADGSRDTTVATDGGHHDGD